MASGVAGEMVIGIGNGCPLEELDVKGLSECMKPFSRPGPGEWERLITEGALELISPDSLLPSVDVLGNTEGKNQRSYRKQARRISLTLSRSTLLLCDPLEDL